MTKILRNTISNASAWRASDLEKKLDWLHVLSRAEVDELAAAVEAWQRRDVRIEAMTRDDVVLPLLEHRMQRIREDLISGTGIAVIRGLPVERWTEEDAGLAFWSIGLLLGEGVTQSAGGELLGRVYDRGAVRRGYALTRGYQSHAALPMHCDLADLVGLFCYRKARKGGDSFLSSTSTIYNVLLAEHPEYLELFYRGFFWSRNGEQDPDEATYSPERIPTFVYEGGQLSSRINRKYATGGMELAGLQLSADEQQAVQFLADVSWREDVAFKQTMEPGDVQLLNNYLVLHSRNEFEDWLEPERQRLLFRLWLRVPGIRDFGPMESLMRDMPLIYGNQGRTPAEIERRAALRRPGVTAR